jgi:hypothetical protein
MNTILLLTTICAVAVAIAAGVALVLAYRQEQSRSEARVIALQQLAAEGSDPVASPIVFDDLDVYDDPDAPSRPMFTGEREPAPWGRRAIAAAAMASLVFVAGYVLLPRGGDATRATAAATPTATPLPIELLSLRHTPETGRLVITGLVQNPRGGAPLTRVVATAFLFSADGTFLASGRAPLDFSTLAGGDESPFVVSVPVTSPVARYRIGFRSESGQVIAHVDRRASGTLARTGE